MNKNDKKMLAHALSIAECSDYGRYHMGCVVAQKNTVLNTAFNTCKTHPLQKKYNRERFPEDDKPHYLHAEIHALAPLLNEEIEWSKVTVYIARKRKCDGENGMARPCAGCMKMIKSLGVKGVVYTTNFGTAEERID